MGSSNKVIGDIYKAHEQPGSPSYHRDANGRTCQRVFRGSTSVIKAMEPSIGASMFDLGDSSLLVTSTDIRSLESSEISELVVALSNNVDSEMLNPDLSGETIEVEWSQIDKPLEQHPLFKDLTKEELKLISNVLNDKAQESEIKNETALKLYEKKRRGQDSYLVFAPVVRRTTKQRSRPTSTSCGKISSPPVGVAGYTFLKSADRASKNSADGYWTRQEEWLGADSWDKEIYK